MRLGGKIARLTRSFTAGMASPDDEWAAPFLVGGELEVFLAMDPRDREHAVRVARQLWQDRPDVGGEVLAAALLHDCGKSVRPYRLWERVAAGLVPQEQSASLPWGPLQVRAHHPQLGAQLIRERGGRERVAQLVERHHSPGSDEEACLLHHYDDLE